ncbi:MAG: glycosyltransferase family 39 protein [Solirubrobacteraceae bacterium]
MAAEGNEATETGERPASPRAAGVVLGVLTLVALVLRATQLDESLFGDELFTYDLVHGHGLLGVIRDVRTGVEDNPPLFYVLAWLSSHIGDPTVWIRLPSVILGTATVPLTYLLGRMTVGRAPALFAATVVAISPFTVFYGIEARGYALLGFLSVLTTVLLLRARSRGGGWWWALAGAWAAMLYTHYTGAFVLAAQLVWVLWRSRAALQPFALSAGAAVLLYAPWLPTEFGKSARIFTVLGPLHAGQVWRNATGVFPGHPLMSLGRIPGGPLAGVALAAAAAALAWGAGRLALRRVPLSDGLALLILLAAVAPLGVLGYSWLEHNIFLARNMMASLAAILLLLGWAIASLPRVAGLAAGAATLAAVLVGSVLMLQPSYQRAPYRAAAGWVGDRYRPGDSVLDYSFRPLSDPLARTVSIYLPGTAFFEATIDEAGAWRRAARGGRVFIVLPQAGPFQGLPPSIGPAGLHLRRQAGRIFPGLTSIGAAEYGSG